MDNKKSKKGIKVNMGVVKTVLVFLAVIGAFIAGAVYQNGVDNSHIQVNINTDGGTQIVKAATQSKK